MLFRDTIDSLSITVMTNYSNYYPELPQFVLENEIISRNYSAKCKCSLENSCYSYVAKMKSFLCTSYLNIFGYFLRKFVLFQRICNKRKDEIKTFSSVLSFFTFLVYNNIQDRKE